MQPSCQHEEPIRHHSRVNKRHGLKKSCDILLLLWSQNRQSTWPLTLRFRFQNANSPEIFSTYICIYIISLIILGDIPLQLSHSQSSPPPPARQGDSSTPSACLGWGLNGTTTQLVWIVTQSIVTLSQTHNWPHFVLLPCYDCPEASKLA